MKIALLFVALLTSPILAAKPVDNWDWNRLRFLDLRSPNPKWPDVRREQFMKTQAKKLLSRGAPFKGRAKILSVAKHDGEWTFTAEQGFTEDGEIRHRINVITSEQSSGTSSTGAFAGGSGPSTRRPLLTWSATSKPTFGRGDVVVVIGSIVDAKWDDSTITATIKTTSVDN